MRCFAGGTGTVVLFFSIITLLFTTGCNRGQVDALKAESARIASEVSDARTAKDLVLEEAREQKDEIVRLIQAGNETLQDTVTQIASVEQVLRDDASDPTLTPEQRAVADKLGGELVGLRKARDRINAELATMNSKLDEINSAADDRIAQLDATIDNGIDRINDINDQIQQADNGWDVAETAILGVGTLFGGGAVTGIVIPILRRARAVAQTADAFAQVIRNVSEVVMPDLDDNTKRALKSKNIATGVQGHVKTVVG